MKVVHVEDFKFGYRAMHLPGDAMHHDSKNGYSWVGQRKRGIREVVREIQKFHPGILCYRMGELVVLPARDSDNVRRLKAALEFDRSALGPLADALEEDGHPDDAYIFRWLLGGKKFPSSPQFSWARTWNWWREGDVVQEWFGHEWMVSYQTRRCRVRNRQIPEEAMLPAKLFTRLQSRTAYKSLWSAISAVARAIERARDSWQGDSGRHWGLPYRERHWEKWAE